MDDIKISAIASLYVCEQYKKHMQYKKKNSEEKINPVEETKNSDVSRDFYDENRGRRVNLLV
jgi:hypothetical protein